MLQFISWRHTSSFLVLMSFVTSSLGFIFLSAGLCPEIPPQQDFDLKHYLGRWYIYQTYDSPDHLGLSCMTTEYSLKPAGRIQVRNRGVRDIRIIGRSLLRSPMTSLAEAHIPDLSQTAVWTLVSQYDPGSWPEQTKYQIVDTDYKTYSLVYSCTQPYFIPFKIEKAMIMTRQMGDRPVNLEVIKQNLRQYGVDTDNFRDVDYTNC